MPMLILPYSVDNTTSINSHRANILGDFSVCREILLGVKDGALSETAGIDCTYDLFFRLRNPHIFQ